MNLVVDASVVVKWFVPERDHEQALAIRDDYLDGDASLFAPALLPFEVINALRYSERYADETLVAASESLAGYGIEMRPLSNSGAVAPTAEELDVSVYDASYVALAEAVDGRAYTADEALLAAASDSEHADRLAHVAAYD